MLMASADQRRDLDDEIILISIIEHREFLIIKVEWLHFQLILMKILASI